MSLRDIVDRITSESSAKRELELLAESARLGVSVEVLRRQQLEAEKQQEELAEKRREALEYEKAEIQRREQERHLALGRRLGLGVPVHIGHILKFGGLTEWSLGNGLSRGTVTTLFLMLHLKKVD